MRRLRVRISAASGAVKTIPDSGMRNSGYELQDADVQDAVLPEGDMSDESAVKNWLRQGLPDESAVTWSRTGELRDEAFYKRRWYCWP